MDSFKDKSLNESTENTQSSILNRSFVSGILSSSRPRRTPIVRPPIQEFLKLNLYDDKDFQKVLEEADNEPLCLSLLQDELEESEPASSELNTTLPLDSDTTITSEMDSSWFLSDLHIKKKSVEDDKKTIEKITTSNDISNKKEVFQTPKMLARGKCAATIKETPQNLNRDKQLMELNPKIVFSSTKSNIKSLHNLQSSSAVKLKPADVIKPIVNETKPQHKFFTPPRPMPTNSFPTNNSKTQNSLLSITPAAAHHHQNIVPTSTSASSSKPSETVRPNAANKENQASKFSLAHKQIISAAPAPPPPSTTSLSTSGPAPLKHSTVLNQKYFAQEKQQNNAGANRMIYVNNKPYMVLHDLGRGGSSVVYNCYDSEKRLECAIKKVNLNIESCMMTGYINEVKMLKKLQDCDMIIRMYDFEIKHEQKEMLVVLEKGSIDLSKILKISNAKTARLPTYRIIFYWMDMLYAVKQIHQNGVIHSDLKPANFLMAGGHLKLIDFGIASCVQADMTSVLKDVTVGSFNYISPEALRDNSTNGSASMHKPKYKINYKSDVWSLGCILYELVYRRTPFHSIGHIYAKLAAIMDPNHRIMFPEVEGIPPSLINAIKMCLCFEPKSRPSVDDLINLYPYN